MIYFFISAIFITIALYVILAILFKLPSFKVSFNIAKHVKASEVKKNPFEFLATLSKPLSKYVTLSLSKQLKLEGLLTSSGSAETPNQYVARLIFTFTFICIFAVPLSFISPWLILIPLVAAIITVVIIDSEMKDKSQKVQELIEDEVPRFIESFSHSIRTNRNVINIFDTYTLNYDTYFSNELKKTVADMRTGSQEIALQRFELRMNNSMLSQLVRGILATMRGEDMTIHFDELVHKMSAMRKQRLTAQALKIKPKISALSLIRAMWSIGVLLVVAMVGILSQY